MKTTSRVAVAALAFACAACGSGRESAPTRPQGPPAVQEDVVGEHASQFDETLADRPAGSQRELAAATYLLAHLQRAGYTPLLDPVPVQDLIRSTNVVADPPRGGDPTTVVVVAYDTGAGDESNGDALGTWLELARALYAQDPDHSVGFVALGAEHAAVAGGHLGSRRLAEYLIDANLSPTVVEIGAVSGEGTWFEATGSASGPLTDVARRLGISASKGVSPPEETSEVFAKAGFLDATVSGSVDGVARVLLDALGSGASPTASPR